MSAGTWVAIAVVAVAASGYIGWLFGFGSGIRESQAVHDRNAVLAEALKAAQQQAEEQWTARYEAGISDALAAVRERRSSAGVKAAVTRAMRRQVQAAVAETVAVVEAA